MTMPSARPLLAVLLAGILVAGTIPTAFAQNAPQAPPSAPTPHTEATIPAVSLGVSRYDYSRGPRSFPNLTAPYRTTSVPGPVLTNAPRIDQMIHDGKLELSLQDTIELALENNMDIVVARYNPWLADTSILKTKSGGFGGGTLGGAFASSTANLPSLSFDPLITSTVSFDDRTTPVNNPFLSGVGTATLAGLISHTANYNTQISQGFSTGTTAALAWDNQRGSSTSAFNTFNPFVQSSLNFSISQNLLRGFGRSVNRRNIVIAKNNRNIADLAFAQQAITSVTNVITAYWELVYARENVKVQQQAVTVAEKLYNDNKKQLEIGTMAPLDVTRAESELATDHQNLIVAQTAQLQQQQVLKNLISKNPLAPNFVDVEIIPTQEPAPPAAIEAPTFQDSVNEAFAKRPDLQEEVINLQNAEIDVRATHNALLPTATVSALYSSVGLAGNKTITGTPVVSAGNQIVNANGNPVTVTDPTTGQVIPIFQPVVTTPVSGISQQGFGTAQSQIFHNNFPDYAIQFSLQIPLRNRSAQSDHIRALLTQSQLQAQMQQLKNSALLDVRNTYIALEQDRARVDAATKARELQQQTFEAEQKKYQLGASTVYNVILTQRDYIAAQGTELRALADLVEAKANYERALGRTLEVNHVSIAGALSGGAQRDTLIPGTLHGQVIGTDELFKELSSGEQLK
jgi:outer membrane protein